MKLSPYHLALTFTVGNLSLATSAHTRPAPQVVEFSQTSFEPETRFLGLEVLIPKIEIVASQDVSEEIRRKLRHEFGFTFLVYREEIQEELGLTLDQRAALDKYLREIAPADMAFLQTSEAHQGKTHQDEFEAFRTKAIESLDAVLKQTLSDAQRTRLGELVRQRENLFGGPTLWTGMDITDEEKAKFMALIEPMHKKLVSVAEEAQRGTDPTEFEHRVLGLRAELEAQLEAVLTESQRKRWKVMLGKPVAVEALFDMVH